MPHRLRFCARGSAGLLGALLVMSSLSPIGARISPARAADDTENQPVARLLVTVTELIIEDDHEIFGEGSLELIYQLANEAPAPLGRNVYEEHHLLANSGDILPRQDYLLLSDGDYLPVYPNGTLKLLVFLDELDDIAVDRESLGVVDLEFRAADNWGMGLHEVQSVMESGAPGDYRVQFIIQHAPLSDLEPVSIKTLKLPGTTGDTVCVGVLNREVKDPGPFKVTLRVNGVVPTGGIMDAGRLAPGDNSELCVETSLPMTAELAATVDEEQVITEYNETNNRLVQMYTASQGISAPSVAPSPSPSGGGKANLAPLGILVGATGGGSDCDPGKNDVTVPVRNLGTGPAEAFTVRLEVDDDDLSRSVAGLASGKDIDVVFKDLQLKKGQHPIVAKVDPKKDVPEEDEDDNEAKVTVNCRDE